MPLIPNSRIAPSQNIQPVNQILRGNQAERRPKGKLQFAVGNIFKGFPGSIRKALRLATPQKTSSSKPPSASTEQAPSGKATRASLFEQVLTKKAIKASLASGVKEAKLDSKEQGNFETAIRNSLKSGEEEAKLDSEEQGGFETAIRNSLGSYEQEAIRDSLEQTGNLTLKNFHEGELKQRIDNNPNKAERSPGVATLGGTESL
jgi:hypothetical protein